MKNLKIILTIILLCALSSIKAQSNTTSNLLQNKLWTYKDHEMAIKVYTITKSQTFYNGTLQMEESYYISETEVTEGNFDATKVGRTSNGKYIATPTGCYEIINISNTNLVLKNIRQTHNVYLFVK